VELEPDTLAAFQLPSVPLQIGIDSRQKVRKSGEKRR